MEDEIRKGKYQHYKGDFYEVICLANHSENGEDLVIYQSLKDKKIWARPKSMFLENIVIDGVETSRFRFVG